MFSIELKQSIIDYSKELVEKNNFGQRSYDNGNKKEQLIGIISENTIRNHLGYEMVQAKGFDGGYDIMYRELKTDIKSMTRNVDPKLNYINNIFDAQIKHNSEAYIFSSLNVKNKTLTVCGWITKEEFLKKAIYYPKGTERKRGSETFVLRANNWEIENRHLHDF